MMARQSGTELAMGLIVLLHIPAWAEESIPQVVKRIAPAVVTIVAYDHEGQLISQGSGFVIGEGQIVSSRHVLYRATRAEAKMMDGRIWSLDAVLADDRAGDLILLETHDQSLSVPALSIEGTLPEVGEEIMVIGSPFGLEQTLSNGLVAAVRNIGGESVIQITVPISPGSSGSPVINRHSQVIGVVSAGVEGGQNLNFAIPAARVKRLQSGPAIPLNDWTAKIQTEAERLYGTGLRYFWNDDCPSALQYLNQTVHQLPDYADAWFRLGYCRSQLGDHVGAIDAFQRAINLQPDHALALTNLGISLSKLGRWQEAVEPLKTAIRSNPSAFEPHAELGAVYGELGRFQDALAADQEALRIAPNTAIVYYNLGSVYEALGQPDQEVAAYQQAIRIQPVYPEAYDSLGVTYSRLGQWKEAVEAFKAAIDEKADFAEAYYNLGVAYANLLQWQQAIRAYQQALRIRPDYVKARANLVIAFHRAGDKTSEEEQVKVLRSLDAEAARRLEQLLQ